MPLAIMDRPGSVVRDREETEELETERVKRAAAELGSRVGKARAIRMTRAENGDRPSGSGKEL